MFIDKIKKPVSLSIIAYISFELLLYLLIQNLNLNEKYDYLQWTNWFYHPEGKNNFIFYLLFISTTTLYFTVLFFAKNNIDIKTTVQYLPPLIKHNHSKNFNKPLALIALIFIIFQSNIYLPYIINDYYLANEYKYLDESTKLTDNYIVSNQKYLQSLNTNSNDSQKSTFLNSNELENKLQSEDRYYIHHNAYMLSPINEFRLNRPFHEIFSQYGFLSVITTSTLMNFLGEDSINNYEKIMKFYYFFYFIMFIYLIKYLLKDHFLRALAFLFFGISLFKLGFFQFIYAPGASPIRHILDLPILLLLIFYEQNKKLKYLFFAIIFSIVSIWISKDFGQFIFFSLLGVITANILIFYFKGTEKKETIKYFLFLLLCLFILGAISLYTYPLMQNPVTKYFIDGFYSFADHSLISQISIIIAGQWLFLIFQYEKLKSSKLLSIYIFLLFYTQFLYSYPIWGGQSHVSIFLFIFILPSLILLQINHFKFKKFLLFILIVNYLVTYFEGYVKFKKYEKEYMQIFQTHKTYKWDMPKTGFFSTIDPTPFRNSVALIQKYEPSNKIYMISKYDNLLAILSQRYSGFPFFELRSTIITHDDYNMIKNIINSKANILFVDNDIEKDFTQELNSTKNQEDIQQRIPKLKVLKNLYIDVKNNYTLIEKGELISVYKRKEKNLY
jgi:hypothetical protein